MESILTEEKKREFTCWICKRAFYGIDNLSDEEAKDTREFLQEVLRDNYVKQKEGIENYSLCPICIFFVEGGIQATLADKAQEALTVLSKVRGLNSGTAIS